MNKLRCVLPLAVAAVLAVSVPGAQAAVVVNHWGGPGYGVTTVHTTGVYGRVYAGPCCYGGAVAAGVVAGVAAGAVAAAVAVPPPPPPVVYAAAPVVTVYRAPAVVYPAAGYYYVP